MTLQELPIAAKDDALTLLCGELLGAGASRHVYTYVPNPTDTVIKVEMERRWFQNVKEWMVWEAVRHVDHARPWFAPAIRISEFGVFMLQERTRPVTLAELRKELQGRQLGTRRQAHRVPRLRDVPDRRERADASHEES